MLLYGMRFVLLLLVIALTAGAGVRSSGQCVVPQGLEKRQEPGPWEGEIAAFEAADRLKPPPKGAVLFVGGSSIRMWPNLEANFPGATVIQRGFGGGELSQVVYYAPRIVLPYCPRLIVLYAGDNDVFVGKSPEQVLEYYKKFVSLVRESMPQTKIAFVAIKPSRSRWAVVDKMRAANDLVREYSSRDTKLAYVDVFTPMLGATGVPRDSLYDADQLHLSAQGYALWRDLLAPLIYSSAPGTNRK